MKTEVRVVDEANIDREIIERAGSILKAGGLVAFPTETVYGLGGDALNRESSKKIYAAKGRPSDNPLIVHIADMESLAPIVESIPETAEKLAEKYWPGPLTIILKKSERVPAETTGGLDTVAVRMPKHQTALALIRAAGGYVAAPSANTSGKPSPTLAQFVKEDMDGRIDMIIDGGQACIGVESTIVDLTGEAPKAPGMKYRHYAPKGQLTIITGEEKKVIAAINERAEKMHRRGQKVGVIGTKETVALYRADSVKCAGSRREETTVAKELYRILREFDDENVTMIYSEAFENTGIGQAVMNRLLKAAGHRIERID